MAEGLRAGLERTQGGLLLVAPGAAQLQPQVEIGAEPAAAEPALVRQGRGEGALHPPEIAGRTPIAVDRPRRRGQRLEPERDRAVGALEDAAAARRPHAAGEPVEEPGLVRTDLAAPVVRVLRLRRRRPAGV